jgi:hypothetical protein
MQLEEYGTLSIRFFPIVKFQPQRFLSVTKLLDDSHWMGHIHVMPGLARMDASASGVMSRVGGSGKGKAMTYMLCRNRLVDFARWKRVFESHAAAHRAVGMNLLHLWRSVDDPSNVFFLFEVNSMAKARDFISAPEGAEAGRASGVIDGEMHFLEEIDKY